MKPRLVATGFVKFARRIRGFAAAGLLCISTAALAHHGMGLYDRSKPVELHGVIRGIDFVNPHSYLRFDAIGADGKTIAMRCEMRAPSGSGLSS